MRRQVCAAVAAVAALGVVIAPASYAESGATASGATQSVRQVVGRYGPSLADTSTTYVPIDPGPHPAVVFVHGGAWTRSQPNAGEMAFGKALAQSHDWVVSVIGYPTTTVPARVVEPAAVQSALSAVEKLADVDADRVALWGESAGGHLALLTSYRDATHRRKHVDAVVSISGPTDMPFEYRATVPALRPAVVHFEGVTPAVAASLGSEQYVEDSPDRLVTSASPPTFQAVSVGDPLVPRAQVSDLTRALSARGVGHETFDLTGDSHATPLETQLPPGRTENVEQLAVDFLARRFAEAIPRPLPRIASGPLPHLA